MSNKLRLLWIVSFSLCMCIAGSSHALASNKNNDIQPTKAYDECLESSNGVTVTLRRCANEELRRQDSRLNRLYRKLLERSEPHRREKLKSAQLAWIQLRDRQCEYEAALEQDGTIWPLIITSCHIDFTIRRADQMQSWIEQR